MISKLTKSAVLAMLTLTLFAALPQLVRAQETDTLSVPTGQLTSTGTSPFPALRSTV